MYYLPTITSPEDHDFTPLFHSKSPQPSPLHPPLQLTYIPTNNLDSCTNPECPFCSPSSLDHKETKRLKELRHTFYWQGVIRCLMLTFQTYAYYLCFEYTAGVC